LFYNFAVEASSTDTIPAEAEFSISRLTFVVRQGSVLDETIDAVVNVKTDLSESMRFYFLFDCPVAQAWFLAYHLHKTK
jgi:hypothetical protein